MIIAKYEKLNEFAMLSHKDILHNFCRTIRRANLHVNFSEGFNPHERIYFGNPTSLGQQSLCEYVAIDSEEKAGIFLQKFNQKAAGTKIILSKNVANNPNFAHIIVANEFEMTMQGIENYSELVGEIAVNKNYILKYKNGKEVSTADKILSHNLSQNKFIFTCKCGMDTLKADELAGMLNAECGMRNVGYSLIKTAQFYMQNNKLKNVDELF